MPLAALYFECGFLAAFSVQKQEERTPFPRVKFVSLSFLFLIQQHIS
jgi:hypothetical protein